MPRPHERLENGREHVGGDADPLVSSFEDGDRAGRTRFAAQPNRYFPARLHHAFGRPWSERFLREVMFSDLPGS